MAPLTPTARSGRRSAPGPDACRLRAPSSCRSMALSANDSNEGRPVPSVGAGPHDEDRRLAPALAVDLAALGQDHAADSEFNSAGWLRGNPWRTAHRSPNWRLARLASSATWDLHSCSRVHAKRWPWPGSLCPKAAVRAMPARLLLVCLLFRSSWLTVEGGRGRRRHSAASPRPTGSRRRVGRRGWWRSKPAVSAAPNGSPRLPRAAQRRSPAPPPSES